MSAGWCACTIAEECLLMRSTMCSRLLPKDVSIHRCNFCLCWTFKYLMVCVDKPFPFSLHSLSFPPHTIPFLFLSLPPNFSIHIWNYKHKSNNVKSLTQMFLPSSTYFATKQFMKYTYLGSLLGEFRFNRTHFLVFIRGVEGLR